MATRSTSISINFSGLLFLVQVNPDTGEARQFNAPQGPGAWAFIAGPDERIYLGTWDGALILRFDPTHPAQGIEVVGKPSATEDYLWQFDLGTDGKLYACTYPNAKLVRFDPKTAAMEDLGLSARAHDRILRMARTIADLDGAPEIKQDHLNEAIGYRSLDRRLWAR